MPEPAHRRPVTEARGNAPDVFGPELEDEKLRELRRLLLGPEMAQLARLQKRLDDPEQRVEDLAPILPAARIRKVLEQLIRAIVKYDRDMVADVVGQILPGAVKNAVTHALREFSERLNEITEKRFSFRALAWRFEAMRTGRPFSEIVLSRSLLYSVREVFLIHSKTGILLQQVAREGSVTKDSDSISSMFSALQEFVRDSFIGTESNEIETIELGSFKFVIQHGHHAILAGAVDGGPPAALKGVFRAALDDIEKNFAADLSAFHGDVEPFLPTRPILECCLLGASGATPRRTVIPWLAAGAAAAALVAWGVVSLIHRHRWNEFVARLRSEPGIIVTDQEMEGSQYVVYGLRDQLAPDPAVWLQSSGIAGSRVQFRLEPYQSLDPRIAAVRDFDRRRSEIESRLIRFEAGSSQMDNTALDQVDAIAAQVRSLLQSQEAVSKQIRIELTGHTDDLGAEDVNSHLALDRAQKVAEALAGDGLERGILTTRGVGTAEPVRKGTSDRDRSFNRSVTLSVRVTP